MAGILYGVGVGPGDPDLLTMKAIKIIQKCDMIGIPAKKKETCTAYQIALKAIPDLEDKPVVSISVPMTTDQKRLNAAYDQGSQELIQYLDQGMEIAFLNLGDPTVYGSYMMIHERVIGSGYEAQLVSGVPSFCAVAAALDVSLGTREENIHILPGCYNSQEIDIYSGTKILMKSAGKIKEVKEKLIALEERGEFNAMAVANCGMEDQKIYQDIRDLDENAGYFTTMIIKDVKRR